MKRHWTTDDLIEHFTLLPTERALLDPLRGAHTRLGFAVLLKSFQLDGRFPTTSHEVPAPMMESENWAKPDRRFQTMPVRTTSLSRFTASGEKLPLKRWRPDMVLHLFGVV